MKRWAGLLTGLVLSQGIWASGLQVNPVTVTIRDRSGIIWLTNGADAPLNAQVRVYRWTQDETGEHLVPTRNLVASPPQLRVEVNGKQLVRLVLLAPPEATAGVCEQAYRLTVNELPPARASGVRGLVYVMQYSIPVFVTPQHGCEKIAPALTWAIEKAGTGVRLIATNAGQMHAQLSRLSYIDARGRRTLLNPGLVGYVLAGARMSFPITTTSSPGLFAGGGQIEVFANGAKVVQALSLDAAASE